MSHDIYAANYRGDRDECAETGCHRRTTGHKDYCIDHLDRLPSVSHLSREITTREMEFRRALGGGAAAVDALGPLAIEFLTTIRRVGPVQLKRLAREMDLSRSPRKSKAVTLAYIQALEAAGLIEMVRVERERRIPLLVVGLPGQVPGKAA